MAIFKTGNKEGKYMDVNARQFVLGYILDPYKTPHGFIGYFNLDPNDPLESMNETAIGFGKTRGVQLRHFIISYTNDEISDPALAYRIATEAVRYFSSRYQGAFAVHEDSAHINTHIVINSVGIYDGVKYNGTRSEFHSMMNYIKKIHWNHSICIDYRSNHTGAYAKA